MADAPAKTAVTIDDLLRMGAEDKWVEIIDGEIVEMSPTGFRHNYVSANAMDILRPFTKEHKLGYVGGDGLIYVLHMEKNEAGENVRYTRVPDVSFIRQGKFPSFDFTKPVPGAPDLAVEVISPSESESIFLSKVESYFRYGTEQVWLLFPEFKTVYQYLDFKTVRVHTGDDILTAESLFPGLSIKVSDFFIQPDMT